VTGEVIEATAKNAVLQLSDGIKASLRVSEIRHERVEDLRDEIKVGDKIEAKIINVDRKNRMLNVSIKAKDEVDNIDDTGSEAKEVANPTLGDIMKDKIDIASKDDGSTE